MSEQERRISGWLILEPDKVPDAWRDRVTEMAWVPLLPEEAEGILRHGSAELARRGF